MNPFSAKISLRSLCCISFLAPLITFSPQKRADFENAQIEVALAESACQNAEPGSSQYFLCQSELRDAQARVEFARATLRACEANEGSGGGQSQPSPPQIAVQSVQGIVVFCAFMT
jgi:hypothetical protein